MSDPVAEKVIATLASVKRVPAENIKLDTNLQEMGIDSLDVFTLLFELKTPSKSRFRMMMYAPSKPSMMLSKA